MTGISPQTMVAGGNELLDNVRVLNHVGVAQGMVVGDLGCGGSGIFTLQAAKVVGENGKVYAVDILKTVLKNIETKAKIEGVNNVLTVWSDLEIYKAAKIPDHALDVALLINVLFQIQRPEEVLRETARLIKPGGKLMIVDWKKGGNVPFGPLQEHRIDPRTIADMAEGVGLRRIEMFDAGKYHFGLIFGV